MACSLAEFIPEIVSPSPCSPALVRHTLLIVYFFKELISFIGSLDKCHSSVFNALIYADFIHVVIMYMSQIGNLQALSIEIYLSTTRISMQYHPSFFAYTTDIFRTKTDIPRIFLEHKCIFCE